MSRALDVVTLTGEEYDALLADAERYRFLRGEGCMWFTGEHVWRSLYRCDHEVDAAMGRAASPNAGSSHE